MSSVESSESFACFHGETSDGTSLDDLSSSACGDTVEERRCTSMLAPVVRGLGEALSDEHWVGLVGLDVRCRVSVEFAEVS